MDELFEHLKAFIAKIKDDPALSTAFRLAAEELHVALNQPAEPAEPPADPAPPAADTPATPEG